MRQYIRRSLMPGAGDPRGPPRDSRRTPPKEEARAPPSTLQPLLLCGEIEERRPYPRRRCGPRERWQPSQCPCDAVWSAEIAPGAGWNGPDPQAFFLSLEDVPREVENRHSRVERRVRISRRVASLQVLAHGRSHVRDEIRKSAAI